MIGVLTLNAGEEMLRQIDGIDLTVFDGGT